MGDADVQKLYRDRLRYERRGLCSRLEDSRISEERGLLVEAVLNLAETIQTCYEDHLGDE